MMKTHLMRIVLGLLISSECYAMMEDDPWIVQFDVHELEYRKKSGDTLKAWDMQLSLGQDLQQWTLAWQAEADEDEIENSELSLNYGKAISPYWNATLGLTHDNRPQPQRSWMQLGLEGLAPFFIDTKLDVLVDEDGDMGLRIQLEQELMLSQRWQLNTGLEINVYAQNDRTLDIESGVQKIELALRLAYGVTRQFAPYIGIVHERQTSLSQPNEDVTWAVAGLSFWF